MNVLNNQAVVNAKEMLAAHFEGIAQVPEPLRNTVANIYYRYCCLSLDMAEANPLPKSIFTHQNPLRGIEELLKEKAFLVTCIQTMQKTIPGLRILENTDRDEFEEIVSISLDVFRYRIIDAGRKSALRRSIERKLSSQKNTEIDGLWRLF
jgi:hypothetical protein